MQSVHKTTTEEVSEEVRQESELRNEDYAEVSNLPIFYF